MRIPEHLTCLLRNLYIGQEATVRTLQGTTDWFRIGKEVCQASILSPCLFNLYAACVRAKSPQSCWTLCNPVNCSPPGSSVHGLLQARTLEWVAMPFSRGFFLTQVLDPGLLRCRSILYHLCHYVKCQAR